MLRATAAAAAAAADDTSSERAGMKAASVASDATSAMRFYYKVTVAALPVLSIYAYSESQNGESLNGRDVRLAIADRKTAATMLGSIVRCNISVFIRTASFVFVLSRSIDPDAEPRHRPQNHVIEHAMAEYVHDVTSKMNSRTILYRGSSFAEQQNSWKTDHVCVIYSTNTCGSIRLIRSLF